MLAASKAVSRLTPLADSPDPNLYTSLEALELGAPWGRRPLEIMSMPWVQARNKRGSEPEDSGIPLTELRADLRSTCGQDSASAPSFVTPGPLESDRARDASPRSATSSSSTSSTHHITALRPDDDDKTHDVLMAEPTLDRRPSQQAAELSPDHKALQVRRQPYMNPVVKSGAFMRGIAAEARAWSARALVGGANRDDVDPVSMLLPEAAIGQRVGGPAGRGPLLRRLQTAVYGMLDDFVAITITRPGPLHIRLRPDPRGLVILNNFDLVPDDPQTGCPQLGPVESVGTVTPGDALVSVNREVFPGRPFSECVKIIREATASASVAEPCVLCIRKADPSCFKESKEAPPRNLEQEKMRYLTRLLEGDEAGVLDEKKLRGITSTGVPDEGGLRPVLWRVLLRCLPPNRLKWPEHLKAQRDLYARFVQDLILKPAENVTQGGGSGDPSKEDENSSLASLAHGGSAPADTSAASGRKNGEGVDSFGSEQGLVGDRTETGHPVATSDYVQTLTENGTRGSISTRGDSWEQDTGNQDVSRSDADRGRPPPAAEVTASVASYSPSSGGSGQCRRGSGVSGELRPTDDDPLSNKESSEWAALWSDKELMQAIEQDVVRTMPDLAFYACRTIEDGDDEESAGVNSHVAEGETGERKRERGEQKRKGRQRRQAISRILFVHAKLNPAESYTQGMNEIVATLYFVLATDDREEWRQHCEADTFFCFTNLMAEIRDVFIQSMDDSENGLHGKMEAFSRTLRQHDPELAQHMASLALDPRYFALRWFTTLLSREFDLPDTIRLWDSLFASEDRSAFLVFLFVTLLLAQREELLAGDFASNLQLLQAYPPTDVPELLAQSDALRLFSAGDSASGNDDSREQRLREAADGARAAAEKVNAAARRLWSAATDLAADAAEKMVALNEGVQNNGGISGGGSEQNRIDRSPRNQT